MYCRKCGNEISDNAKFCVYCGTSVVQLDKAPAKAKKKLPLWVLITVCAVLVAAAIAAAIFYWILPAKATGEADQLIKEAESLMAEEQFEKAIEVYEKVSEKEPADPRSYIGMASAYIKLGDDPKAEEILNRGIDAVGKDNSRQLEEMLKEIKQPTAQNYGEIYRKFVTETLVPLYGIADDIERHEDFDILGAENDSTRYEQRMMLAINSSTGLYAAHIEDLDGDGVSELVVFLGESSAKEGYPTVFQTMRIYSVKEGEIFELPFDRQTCFIDDCEVYAETEPIIMYEMPVGDLDGAWYGMNTRLVTSAGRKCIVMDYSGSVTEGANLEVAIWSVYDGSIHTEVRMLAFQSPGVTECICCTAAPAEVIEKRDAAPPISEYYAREPKYEETVQKHNAFIGVNEADILFALIWPIDYWGSADPQALLYDAQYENIETAMQTVLSPFGLYADYSQSFFSTPLPFTETDILSLLEVECLTRTDRTILRDWLDIDTQETEEFVPEPIADWGSVYMDSLTEWISAYSGDEQTLNGTPMKATLLDLNFDGVPELLMHENYGGTAPVVDISVYTAANGYLEQVDTTGWYFCGIPENNLPTLQLCQSEKTGEQAFISSCDIGDMDFPPLIDNTKFDYEKFERQGRYFSWNIQQCTMIGSGDGVMPKITELYYSEYVELGDDTGGINEERAFFRIYGEEGSKAEFEAQSAAIADEYVPIADYSYLEPGVWWNFTEEDCSSMIEFYKAYMG